MATTIVTIPRSDGWVECSFDQGAAEAADLVADPGDGLRIYVKDFVATMSAAGTLKLESGTDDLIPTMPMVAGVPLVVPSMECAKSAKLAVTSGTTAAKGRFLYKVR